MELLTEYLLREFRMQFRDAATQRTVFKNDSVSSWFRAGDYY